MRRTDLQHALLAPVTDLVRTDITPVAINTTEDAMAVEFDQAPTEEFDAVIGADGINSWTRRTVLSGPEPTYTGSAVVRFQVPNIDRLDTSAMTTGEIGARLGYFVMNGGTTLHGMLFLPGEPDNRREATLSMLADRFAGAHGPIESLVRAMRTEPESFYTNIGQVDAHT